ncbi:MAG: sulfatase [Sinobacteraceae bacterium]|nr:sulfatase [Nevskiaceae bacterium]
MVYGSDVNRPNVLLIVTDQHRADHLGCYGNRQLRTPHIDGIAARGQRFERCYVANPICMPNRATLLTGRMPSVNGVRHNGVPLPIESMTFAEVMRRAGYRTALIGKAHLQSQSRREVPDPLLFSSMRPNDDRRENWPTALPDVTNDSRYLAEREELWAADPHRQIALPYYGFEHVEFACGHGDQVGGHYRTWARARVPNIDQLIGPTNALPGSTRAPQAWRTAVPEAAYPTSFVEERTVAALERFAAQGATTPFLLQCSFPDPHHPFTPPGRYWGMYDPREVELPASFGHVDSEEVALLRRLRAFSAQPDFLPGRFCTQFVSESALREAIALSYGSISMIDDAVGRILGALRRLGLEENTVVVFTSDHGDLMGDHSLIFKQGFHYEGVIRVPLLWRDPASAQPAVRGQVVSTLDLARSILCRVGLGIPVGMQGVNIMASSIDREGVVIEEDELPIHMGELGPVRLTSYIDSRWRLTLWHGDEQGELFDRESDPHELRNLWSEPSAADARSRLTESLLRARLQMIDVLPLAHRSA